MEASDTHRVAETVFRIERARLIAGLNRMVRDVGFAEDLAQEALVTALSEWQKTGVPQNPAGWLMATAKRRAIDVFRRRRMQAQKHTEIGHDLSLERDTTIEEVEAAMDDDIGDERLSLIFTACHPLLSVDARVALTLKLVGGLTTEEIARAFLSSEPTIAQRIVRAKKTLAASGLAYEVPRGEERAQRLAAVLEVVYLIFNEGYAASAGDDAMRPQLCTEAMRLCRILSGLVPDEPEVHGLLALMELHASRFPARTSADGAPVMITEQNRARWDRILIQHGLAALGRAERLGGADDPYVLQAAIVACHARAPRAADTDWREIAALYDRLSRVMPSPVVGLNRAIAHSMAYGPETGLELLAPLEAEPALQGYAGMPAARGDFLMRAGRNADAKAAFEKAARLAGNAAERQFLVARAATCGGD